MQELKNYIKDARVNGVSEEEIVNKLKQAGWNEKDINQSFMEVSEVKIVPKSRKDIPKVRQKKLNYFGFLKVSNKAEADYVRVKSGKTFIAFSILSLYPIVMILIAYKTNPLFKILADASGGVVPVLMGYIPYIATPLILGILLLLTRNKIIAILAGIYVVGLSGLYIYNIYNTSFNLIYGIIGLVVVHAGIAAAYVGLKYSKFE